MLKGGVATVIVSDMNRAIRFYTELLGLKLEQRFGNEWASIKAPSGLVIGLHPMSSKSPAGRSGSISIGFELDEPLEQAVQRLKKQGVEFRGPILDDDPVRIALFGDPDGNDLYLSELSADYKSFAAQAKRDSV